MFQSGALNLHALTTLGTMTMALLAVFVRSRASRKPASAAKIIMPPLGMSTGFLMFLFPFTRIPLSWGVIAFALGAVILSYPLIRTSKLEIVDGHIYLQKSRQLVIVLLGLLTLRLALHSYIEQFITLPQTGAVFFTLAFGMLLPWRLAMYAQFRKLEAQLRRQNSGE